MSSFQKITQIAFIFFFYHKRILILFQFADLHYFQLTCKEKKI